MYNKLLHHVMNVIKRNHILAYITSNLYQNEIHQEKLNIVLPLTINFLNL